MQYLAIGHGKIFTIELDDAPLSGGGQGNVYRISYPFLVFCYFVLSYPYHLIKQHNNQYR